MFYLVQYSGATASTVFSFSYSGFLPQTKNMNI